MKISLEAAEAINNFTVMGFGLALVFVGLISIIIICAIMGAVCKNVIKDKPKTSVESAPVTASKKPAQIADKGKFVAAVSAAIAEDLGTDVSGIRIHSIKQL